MITGWLSPEDCPDCGGPLLDTSTDDLFLTLECPGCGYRTRWHATDPDPDRPRPRRDGGRMTQRTTRAERLAMPLARDVVRDLAVTHGGCVRPVQLRRTDLHTGQAEQVLVPCGHTLATVCPSCAERAKALRAAQCREGWHLDPEPIVQADEPDDEQRMWVETRAQTSSGTATRRTRPGRTRPSMTS